MNSNSSFLTREEISQTTIPMAIHLSSLIESFCSANKTSVDSVFKCVVPVPISLTEYGHRLGVYMKADPSAYIVAAILSERLFEKHSEYFCSLSAHKLMCSLVLLGVKFTQDIIFGNSYYAEIFGVSLTELNGLELAMLRLLNFSVFVSAQEVERKKLALFKPRSQAKQPSLQRTSNHSHSHQVQSQQQQQQQQQKIVSEIVDSNFIDEYLVGETITVVGS